MPVSRSLAAPGYARGGIAGFPKPFWATQSAALYLGDVRVCLRAMPARSVHTVVTSPPYWGLRDYGTGQWDGGSAECDHLQQVSGMSDKNTLGPDKYLPQTNAANVGKQIQYRDVCGKCGANRTDMQIGAEPSPDCGTHGQAQCGSCFVCSLVGVFREVRRVLRDDGTCWLNLGDSYCGGASGQNGTGPTTTMTSPDRGANGKGKRDPYRGLPSGNLVGVPWRVALALQADGWVLRQDIIWYSPNKMPESVQNRCTKSHEHIFLLAKGGDYYYDSVAIEEETVTRPHAPGNNKLDGSRNDHDRMGEVWGNGTKNKRDVWIVPTTGYPGAHFATYPAKLITPCILAGTSEHGVCAACGRPWERVVARVGVSVMQDGAERRTPPGQTPQSHHKDRDRSIPSNRNGITGSLDGVHPSRETVGWRKECGCQTDEVLPAVVIDPFVGSGTTVATALELGRAGVGIDLSEVYLRENAIPRIEAAMRGEKVPRKPTVAVPPDTPPTPRRLRGG